MCRLVEPPRQTAPSPSTRRQTHTPIPAVTRPGLGGCARPRGPRGWPRDAPATRWHLCGALLRTSSGQQTGLHTCVLGRAFVGYKCQRKKGDHPAWDWEEQSLRAALSVFSEHRLPSACTPHLSLAGPPLLLMLSRLASLSHTEHTIAL